MNLIKLNIGNLTSLWENVSRPFRTYYETEGCAYCYIRNSQWPNRIWVKQNPIENKMPEALHIIKGCKEELTFSYFDHNCEKDVPSILQNGFKEKSCQYGMSLQLHQPFETPSRLSFQLVNNPEDIKLWCDAFLAAFNYKINEVTVEESLRSISYYSILFENQVIGTFILHQTGDVAGVHSLGIIPPMRGKGFAQEAMHFALNLSIMLKAKTVTLQASGMAKPMYEKLGFTTQFIMRNYKLNK